MNYLKNHLIKLLIIPLLLSSNAQAMLKLSRTVKPAAPKFKSILPILLPILQNKNFKFKSGSLFNQILEPIKPFEEQSPSSAAQSKEPKTKKLGSKQKNALQLLVIKEIVENPALFEYFMNEGSDNKAAENNIDSEFLNKFKGSRLVKVTIPGEEEIAQDNEKDFVRTQKALLKLLAARNFTSQEILNNTKLINKALYEASFTFVREPSLQPDFVRLVNKNTFGLAQADNYWKPIPKAWTTQELTLGQQKDLVSQAQAKVQELKNNAFGLSIAELLKKEKSDINFLFKKLALNVHPDKGGDKDNFDKLVNLKDMLLSPEGRLQLKIGEWATSNPDIAGLFKAGNIEAPGELKLLLDQAAQVIPMNNGQASNLRITLPEAEVVPSLSSVQEDVSQALGNKEVSPELLSKLVGNITHKAAEASPSHAAADISDNSANGAIPAEPSASDKSHDNSAGAQESSEKNSGGGPRGPKAGGAENQLAERPSFVETTEDNAGPKADVDMPKVINGDRNDEAKEESAPSSAAVVPALSKEKETIAPRLVLKKKKNKSEKLDLSDLLAQFRENINKMEASLIEVNSGLARVQEITSSFRELNAS